MKEKDIKHFPIGINLNFCAVDYIFCSNQRHACNSSGIFFAQQFSNNQ